MPDDSSDSPTSAIAPATGGPAPGAANPAVPSGGNPATPPPPPGGGVTPPMGSPASTAVQPQGIQARAQALGSQVIDSLHKMLVAYSPHDEQFKAIQECLTKLIKHFPRRQMAQVPTPRMAPGAMGGQPPMGMPQLSGGPPGGAVQRGPVPMPGGGA